MTYNLDTFVNVTAKKLGKRFSFPVNELYNDVDLYERFPKTFANMFKYDAVNEQAYPLTTAIIGATSRKMIVAMAKTMKYAG